MYSLPTAPKTIGGVLDDIFKLFPAALKSSWPLALVAAVVISLPSLMIYSNPDATPEEVLLAMLSPAFWGTYTICMLVYFVLYAALIARVDAAATNVECSIGEAMSRALRASPRILIAAILYGLALIVGFILLVVPGIIWSMSLMFFTVCIMIEDSRIVESLSRSRQLVKGSWWRTAAIFTVAIIIAYLLLFCVQFAVGFLVGFGDDPLGFNLISALVTGVAYIVMLPFFCSASLVVYYDLRQRKEGGDLSDRVASLAKA